MVLVPNISFLISHPARRRSLAVALKQLEVQTAKVDQSEKLLKERLSKKEAEMDMATKEIVRLTHVQRVANQMHEWKAMMEESSKMANEMKTLVSAFGSDMAVTSVQEEPQQKEQENTQLVKKVSATGQPQQNVASEMADPTGALEDALSGISY